MVARACHGLAWTSVAASSAACLSRAFHDADVGARFRVAGWHVVEVDGHDLEAVSAAAARQALGWPHAPFEIPSDILEPWRAAGRRQQPEREAWRARLAALPAHERAEFERVVAGELPAGWREVLADYKQAAPRRDPAASGIFISAEINDALGDVMPERMVACADLEAPINHKRRLQAFTASERRGAYVHCGVREHLMGGMANGIDAHGGVPVLALTYLAFSDYERPAIRMAALMGLPVKFVFSHDSIGIGRNGPTHQPVEILAALRAMPGLLVLRPADAVEAAECWEIALEHRSGPSALVFARQALPHLRLGHTSANLSRRGAYVLAEAEGGLREVTLLATGSEVLLAQAARTLLQAAGTPTAVVSMPCWELFERHDAAYRASVLGAGTVRVGCEAAVRFGWDRWLGERGGFVGMSGFGASGPADELYRHFGITPEAIVAEARRLMATRPEAATA